ncbi:MAG: hypothetical protein ABJN71_03405 [Lentilitoribacter sp.]
MFEIVFAILVLVGTYYAGYSIWIRPKTLNQREDGIYVWREWHGGAASSPDDPSAPGGLWEGEGDGGDCGGD